MSWLSIVRVLRASALPFEVIQIFGYRRMMWEELSRGKSGLKRLSEELFAVCSPPNGRVHAGRQGINGSNATASGQPLNGILCVRVPSLSASASLNSFSTSARYSSLVKVASLSGSASLNSPVATRPPTSLRSRVRIYDPSQAYQTPRSRHPSPRQDRGCHRGLCRVPQLARARLGTAPMSND